MTTFADLDTITFNRFADITDLDTVDGVAIRYYFLLDGRVYETRTNRASGRIIRRRLHEEDSEVAWCLLAM